LRLLKEIPTAPIVLLQESKVVLFFYVFENAARRILRNASTEQLGPLDIGRAPSKPAAEGLSEYLLGGASGYFYGMVWVGRSLNSGVWRALRLVWEKIGSSRIALSILFVGRGQAPPLLKL
jgi:hypothetical protein